jgi:hypothetical protein
MFRHLAVLTGLLLISQPAFAAEWYEGGTLQKATVEDWNRATAENQLATSGDFIASLSGITDLSKVTDPTTAADIKKKAEDLRLCINQTIKVDTLPDTPVAQFVVKCTLLKGVDNPK